MDVFKFFPLLTLVLLGVLVSTEMENKTLRKIEFIVPVADKTAATTTPCPKITFVLLTECPDQYDFNTKYKCQTIYMQNPADECTFYVCNPNSPTLMLCPHSTYFDPVKLECDFITNANRTLKCPSTETTPSPPVLTAEEQWRRYEQEMIEFARQRALYAVAVSPTMATAVNKLDGKVTESPKLTEKVTEVPKVTEKINAPHKVAEKATDSLKVTESPKVTETLKLASSSTTVTVKTDPTTPCSYCAFHAKNMNTSPAPTKITTEVTKIEVQMIEVSPTTTPCIYCAAYANNMNISTTPKIEQVETKITESTPIPVKIEQFQNIKVRVMEAMIKSEQTPQNETSLPVKIDEVKSTGNSSTLKIVDTVSVTNKTDQKISSDPVVVDSDVNTEFRVIEIVTGEKLPTAEKLGTDTAVDENIKIEGTCETCQTHNVTGENDEIKEKTEIYVNGTNQGFTAENHEKDVVRIGGSETVISESEKEVNESGNIDKSDGDISEMIKNDKMSSIEDEITKNNGNIDSGNNEASEIAENEKTKNSTEVEETENDSNNDSDIIHIFKSDTGKNEASEMTKKDSNENAKNNKSEDETKNNSNDASDSAIIHIIKSDSGKNEASKIADDDSKENDKNSHQVEITKNDGNVAIDSFNGDNNEASENEKNSNKDETTKNDVNMDHSNSGNTEIGKSEQNEVTRTKDGNASIENARNEVALDILGSSTEETSEEVSEEIKNDSTDGGEVFDSPDSEIELIKIVNKAVEKKVVNESTNVGENEREEERKSDTLKMQQSAQNSSPALNTSHIVAILTFIYVYNFIF